MSAKTALSYATKTLSGRVSQQTGPGQRSDADHGREREIASGYLRQLDERLEGQSWLFGGEPTLADMAILPFVRQFAMTDKVWFDAQDWRGLHAWLTLFLESERLAQVMQKYQVWESGDDPIHFP